MKLITGVYLDRFFRIDWGQVARDLHEINQGIIELEKLAPILIRLDEAVSKLVEIMEIEYEERHEVKSPFSFNLFDLEK